MKLSLGKIRPREPRELHLAGEGTRSLIRVRSKKGGRLLDAISREGSLPGIACPIEEYASYRGGGKSTKETHVKQRLTHLQKRSMIFKGEGGRSSASIREDY